MIKDEALRLVNDARTLLGLRRIEEFPKGEPKNAGGCPVALALPGVTPTPAVVYFDGGITGAENWITARACATAWNVTLDSMRPGHPRVTPPPALMMFMRDFDEGLYPELVMERNPNA